jgi:microcin C transport system substrate-binding protein
MPLSSFSSASSVILSRRDLIRGLTSAALLNSRMVGGAHAAVIHADEGPSWRHGIALLGDLKYPAQFAQFDYVNARAPKTGTVRRAVVGTFDSFNLVVAGVKGDLVEGIDLIYDTLMVPSLDEVASEYGLIAQAARFPKDYAWVSFRLRPEAKWHDGSPIRVEDVIFSLQTFRKLHPQLAAYYRHVVKAEKGRRARGQVQLRRAGDPRVAAGYRAADGAASTLVDDGGQIRQAPRDRANDIGVPTGLGPVPHQDV